MNILLAGDRTTEQSDLSERLSSLINSLITVHDPGEVISSCNNYILDIILLDVTFIVAHNPNIVDEIRDVCRSASIQIIVVYYEHNQEMLKSIEHQDVDDIICLPIDMDALGLKINGIRKRAALQKKVKEQNRKYHTLLREQSRELKIADHVHSRIIQSDKLQIKGLDSFNIAASSISGDCLFTSVSPNGHTMIMLADFTGTGLSAAISALPSSEIFYGMVNKGFCINDIVTELNKKLYRLLPNDMSCAAVLIEITADCKHFSIWNGGLPSVKLLDTNNVQKYSVDSFHSPLGSGPSAEFESQTRIVHCGAGDVLLLHTDGLTRATNHKGELIRSDIVEHCIANAKQQFPFDHISLYINEYIQQATQKDDISLVVYKLFENKKATIEPESHDQIKPTTWNFNTTLSHDVLGSLNPVPVIVSQIMDYANLLPLKEKLFTVLSELYNNALDHGVLKLDSKLKDSPEGFSLFYEKRAHLLIQLEEGWVKIDASQFPTENGGKLVLKVTDSGEGFDTGLTQSSGISASHNVYHGRGLKLIRDICTDVIYSEKGNSVEAVFEWSNSEFYSELKKREA